MVQGELFREESSSYNLDNQVRRSFLSRHQFALTLDKLLLSLLGVMVIFVLTYSFGVEHGKRTMENHLQSLIPVHSETLPVTNQEGSSAKKTEEQAVLMVNDQTSQETSVAPTSIVDEKSTTESSAVATDEKIAEPQKSSSSLPIVDLTKQGTYTIQLVTYDSETLAAKEIDRLKAKGHEGFVITSGRYFQVCANYFESHTKARSFLKQFRDNSRYPDAFIRPVVR